MIRLALVLLLTALPAAAQDFRGLRPGMDAAALGPLGEPMAIDHIEDATLATYPLPFEQYLEVLYEQSGTIAWLHTSAPAGAPDAPPNDGLRIGEMALDDVFQHLMEDVSPTVTPPLLSFAGDGGVVQLVYSDGADPDVLVILTFLPSHDADISDRQNPANDPTLHSVSLTTRSFLDAPVNLVGPTDIPSGDPRPFPLPLDEAFPSLIP